MDMIGIITKKKRGEELTDEEIREFIRDYVGGRIPDYQVSALLMAVWFNGMNDRETAVLTDAMARSGDMLDLSMFPHTADKHSTGGVGDKTSLIVAPAVASLGATVAKMSGRGLGHTGGTIDKLEAIPGYRTELSPEEFREQVRRIGIAIVGQTGHITPADKMLYALRDVTGTVDSTPLIASSIMSKKLAAGAGSIVLDVKTGSGAFMKTPEDAKALAEKMVRIGEANGRRVSAVLTDMDRPLGKNIGNALEVIEAAEVLRGETEGPLCRVSLALASEMVRLALGKEPAEAEALVRDAIRSGKAFEKMKEWVKAQGGDPSYLEDEEKFTKASYVVPVTAERDGFIASVNTEAIGNVSVLLGAGRKKKGDPIDPAAGIVLEKNVGDPVAKGEPIAFLHTNDAGSVEPAKDAYLQAIRYSETKPDLPKEIYGIVRSDGYTEY